MLSVSTHVFSEIFLHVNCHCKDDHPFITLGVEAELYTHIENYCNKTKGVHFCGIGGTENHVHLVVQIEPMIVLGEWIGRVKGSSSHHINERSRHPVLVWQRGYGVVSFSKQNLQAVLRYIVDQKRYHQNGTTKAALENHGAVLDLEYARTEVDLGQGDKPR